MAEKKKRGPGRPTKYNAALGTRICKRVANGETLREIAETPGMPCESVSYTHLTLPTIYSV